MDSREYRGTSAVESDAKLTDEQILSTFMKACEGKDVVSFDVFDTLVRRTVSQPNHAFLALERQLELSEYLDWSRGLAALRARSEARARRLAWNHEAREEVTLSEIWRVAGQELGWAPEDPRLYSLAEAELDLEHQICVPNELGVQLLNLAIQLGKTVIAVSDTYLPQTSLETILKTSGLGPFHAVFTSSSLMRTKTTGTIWQAVLRDVPIAAHKILHVGDNALADVSVPLQHGLETFHMPSWSPRFKWHAPLNTDLLPYSVLSQRARHNSSSKMGGPRPGKISASGLGESIGAVLLGGYANWLADEIPESVDSVVFLARDGFVVQEAMRAIGREPKQTRRIYVSRRVLRMAALDKPTHAKIRAIVEPFERPTKSVRTALQRLALGSDQRVASAVEARLGSLDRPFLPRDEVPLADLLLREFRDELREAAQPALRNLHDYLAQEGLLSGTHALVDAGWHGSMQAILGDVISDCGGNTTLYGYYFALHQGAQEFRPAAGPMFGFLSDDFSEAPMRRSVDEYVDFIEEVLLPGFGSVAGYLRGEGGEVAPVLLDNPVEARNFAEFVEAFQVGAMETLRQLSEDRQIFPSVADFTSSAVSAALEHLLLYPSDDEVALIGTLRHLPGVNHDGEGYPLAALPAYEGVQAVIDLTGYLWSSGSMRRTWIEVPERRQEVREAAERLRFAYGQPWIDHLTRDGV